MSTTNDLNVAAEMAYAGELVPWREGNATENCGEQATLLNAPIEMVNAAWIAGQNTGCGVQQRVAIRKTEAAQCRMRIVLNDDGSRGSVKRLPP